MCNECIATKQGVLALNTKDDGSSIKSSIDGDNKSPAVGETSYTSNAATAAPVTKNNGNL